jgi:hypothetical protein
VPVILAADGLQTLQFTREIRGQAI